MPVAPFLYKGISELGDHSVLLWIPSKVLVLVLTATADLKSMQEPGLLGSQPDSDPVTDQYGQSNLQRTFLCPRVSYHDPL